MLLIMFRRMVYIPSGGKLNADQGLWTYQHANGLLTLLNYGNKSENVHHSVILKTNGIVQCQSVICLLYSSQGLATPTCAVPTLGLAGPALF